MKKKQKCYKKKATTEKLLIKALYNIGEIFLGKNFLQGNSFKNFIRDGFRLYMFMFLPFISIAIGAIIATVFERILDFLEIL